MEGGADFLLIETCFDTGKPQSRTAGRAASCAANWALPIPVIASVTIERNGTMLGGQPIDALYASIANQRPAGGRA